MVRNDRKVQPGTFGAELRRRRAVAGLSLDQLARRIHYSKGYLSKVENGRRPPSADLGRRCDAELDAGGALVALTPAPQRAAPAAVWNANSVARWNGGYRVSTVERYSGARNDHHWEPQGIHRDVIRSDPPDWWTGPEDDDFRGFPGGVSARTGVGCGVPASARSDAAACAEEQAIAASYWRILADLRKLGRRAQAGPPLRATITQFHTLRMMAEEAGPERSVPWYTLAARHADYAGWLSQEVGDRRTAVWWIRQTARLGHRVGDPDLVAYALVRRAEVAVCQRDARQAIDYARRVQSTGVSPWVRAMGKYREAQGHALVADARRCEAALAIADSLRTVMRPASLPSPPDRDIALGSSTITDLNAIAAGWCFYDLGRPKRSAELLQSAVAGLPAESRRLHGIVGARLALALASAGELESACHIAYQVLESLRCTGSAGTADELRDVARVLIRWRSDRHARILHAEVMAALCDLA